MRMQWSSKNQNFRRQKGGLHSFAPAIPGLIAFIMLSACAANPKQSAVQSEGEIITHSVAASYQNEGVDPSDAEFIKTLVVSSKFEASSETKASNLLAWSNPDTGNSGTITAIDKFAGKHGQSCRKFTTTLDSFMGISLYNGETCELRKGFWVISWLLRASTGS